MKRVDKPESDSGTKAKAKAVAPLPKALLGSGDKDIADLSRRIGDLSVYKYYLKSMVWGIALSDVASCSLYMLAQVFPVSILRISQVDHVNQMALWLTLYTNGTVTSLPLFAVIYAIAALLAFGVDSSHPLVGIF